MAISLKELSEKITKPGFWSPDFDKSKVVNINTKTYDVPSIGFIIVASKHSMTQDNYLYVNDILVIDAWNWGDNSYMTTTNTVIPVKTHDKVVTSDSITTSEAILFIPAILTIYYIVRYNIYKLVRFLSHLNTKFGGERR